VRGRIGLGELADWVNLDGLDGVLARVGLGGLEDELGGKGFGGLVTGAVPCTRTSGFGLSVMPGILLVGRGFFFECSLLMALSSSECFCICLVRFFKVTISVQPSARHSMLGFPFNSFAISTLRKIALTIGFFAFNSSMGLAE